MIYLMTAIINCEILVVPDVKCFTKAALCISEGKSRATIRLVSNLMAAVINWILNTSAQVRLYFSNASNISGMASTY